MQDARAQIEQAAQWSATARELMLTRGQMTRRNLVFVLVLGAVVGLGMGSHSVWLSLHQESRVSAPWPLLVGGLACAGLLLGLRNRDQVGRGTVTALVVALLLANIVAIALNGLPGLTFVAAVVVLCHVILDTRRAGLLACAYLAGVAGATAWHPMPIEAPIVARVLIGGVAVLLTMQMLARHWDRLNLRFGALSQELHHAMDGARRQIEEADAEREQALHFDAMTGLPNVEGFMKTASERLREYPEAVVARLHLDRWRVSMSALQYAEQQAVLQLLIKRCTEVLGPQALIGRAAVDELLIVLPAQGMLAQASVDRLAALQTVLTRPILAGQRVALTDPVIGYARAPLDGQQIAELLDQSTLACRTARLKQSDRPLAFDRRLHDEDVARARLARDLSDALEGGLSSLLFQPVLDATGSPQGAVSRMVWNHPVFGQISPGSARESTDNPELTHRVTMWRLEKALNQARVMRARLGHPFGISVSLPLAWLQEMIARPAPFLDALSNLSVEPGGLVLEIPEDAMLQDSIGLMQIMSLLRSMGIGIALGRFGAGFSSFSFLDRMTLDYLKIDRSFVAQVGRNARETAVCRAIVGVAHELGIRVVADGVKHAGQAGQLAQLGCDLLHGDGLAAAMTGPDLAEWVLAHPSVQTARNGG